VCGFVDFYPSLEGAYKHSSWRGYEAPTPHFLYTHTHTLTHTHTHTHTHTSFYVLKLILWKFCKVSPQRSIYTQHKLNRVFFFDVMTISWILSTVHSSLAATSKAAICCCYYYYYYYYYLSVIILIAKFLRIFHEIFLFILRQARSTFVCCGIFMQILVCMRAK